MQEGLHVTYSLVLSGFNNTKIIKAKVFIDCIQNDKVTRAAIQVRVSQDHDPWVFLKKFGNGAGYLLTYLET